MRRSGGAEVSQNGRDFGATALTALPPLDTLAALTPLQYGDLTTLGLTGWTSANLSSWILKLMNVSTGLR